MRKLKTVIWGCLLIVTISVLGCSWQDRESVAERLDRGKALLAEGKYREAWIEFKGAIQKAPHNAEAHYQLALTYLKMNDFEHAFKELQAVRELDPENLEARIRLGSFYLALGARDTAYFERAKKEAEFVLERDPRNLDARILLGNAYAGLTDFEKSITELKAAVEQDPRRIDSYINLGTIQSARDFAAAERTFKEALRLDEKSLKANLALAALYLSARRLEEAEHYFKLGFEHNPADSQSYLALMLFYLTTGRRADAERSLIAAVEANPNNPEPKRTLASFYLYNGAAEAGLKILSELVSHEPQDLVSRKKLAEALLDLNRLDEAESQVKIITERLKDTDAHLLRGRLLLQRQSIQQAIAELQDALSLAPNSPQAHHFLGLAHFRLGNLDQAKAALQSSLELGSPFIQTRLALAKVYELQNRRDLALEQAEAVLALMPDNPEALLIKGDALLHQGNLSRAEAVFGKVMALAPENPVARHRLGLILAVQGKEQEALQKLEEVLARSPDAADVMADMALLYLRQGKGSQALDRLERQIRLAGNKAPFYELKARLYIAQRNLAEARASLYQAIAADKNLLSAYLLLAGTYALDNQMDQALRELDQVLKLKPDFAQALILRGMVYDAANDHEKAEKNYRAALELNPELPVAANNLAWIYAEKYGDLDPALSLAQQAKEKLPDNTHVADTLGWILYKKNNLLLAIDQLKFSVAKEPKNPIFRYHLGMALYKKGEIEQAKRELEAALRLGLGQTEATEARRTLAALSTGG